jgi:hypothetical protein
MKPSDQWTYRFDAVLETYDLVSPTGRQVAEVPELADAKSLVELLNDGLKLRMERKET